MATIVRRRPGHSDWAELFGWPFTEEGQALSQRLAGFRADLLKVEEFTDGDTHVVRAEMPGVEPAKDVEVSVTDGMLTLKAERREQTRSEADGGVRSEFHYGALTRVVALPAGAKEAEIVASYTDGILEVRVPVEPAQEPPTRTVEIKHG